MIFIIVGYFGGFAYGIFRRKIEIQIRDDVLGVEYVRKNGRATVIVIRIIFTRLEKDRKGKVQVLRQGQEETFMDYYFLFKIQTIYKVQSYLIMEEEYFYGAIALAFLILAIRIGKMLAKEEEVEQIKEEEPQEHVVEIKSKKRSEKEVKQVQETKEIKVEKKAEVTQAAEDKKKKKKKKGEQLIELSSIKQLEQKYSSLFYGTLSLKMSSSMTLIDAIALKNSKLLFSTSKNQLVLYDLKRWKKGTPCQDRFYVSLDNNNATAIAIGANYYYVALNFDKTISYYQFKGGQKGIYFKQVKKFSRNLFKTDLNSLYVNDSETFIVGTGSENDTQVYIWSMNGQKLTQINTCQIEHYDTRFGGNKMIIRGWTTSVKRYSFSMTKEQQFVKLQNNHSLNHQEKIKCSAIDNMGLYSVTVSGSDNELVKIWKIMEEDSTNEKTADAFKVGIEEIAYCSIQTLRDENDRLRTIVVLANSNKLVICDKSLKVIDQIQGINVQGLYMTGTMKNIVLGTQIKGGKFIIWNIKGLIQKIDQFAL